jgi:Zn-dependent protease with chaperone function
MSDASSSRPGHRRSRRGRRGGSRAGGHAGRPPARQPAPGRAGTSRAGRSGSGQGRGARAARHAAEGPGAAGAPRASRIDDAPRTGRAPTTALGAHEAADKRTAAQLAANRRRTQSLCLVAASVPAVVVAAVVGVAAGAGAGAGAGVAALVVVWVVVIRNAAALALRIVGGRPARPGELPGLANLVDGLCGTLGVERPDLWLVDDPVPNACALDGAGRRGVLVVTSGLVERMGLIELEGVLAHELVHLKRRDAVVSAVAVATAGIVALATGGDALVHAAVGKGREYDADQAAVLAVRYPPGLRDALGAMATAPPPRSAGGPARSCFGGRRWSATRWMWIDPMVGARDAPLGGQLDATPVRRDALDEW